MGEAKGSLDLVIDTIPAYHDPNPYGNLVRVTPDASGRKGKLCLLGAHEALVATFLATRLIPCSCYNGPWMASGTGSLSNTQACIDFCAKHNITPRLEVVPATPKDIARIYTNLESGNDAGIRYVLDIGNHLTEEVMREKGLQGNLSDNIEVCEPVMNWTAHKPMSGCKVCCLCCRMSFCVCCPH